MRGNRPKFCRVLGASLAISLAMPGLAAGADFSQIQAIAAAEAVNHTGSDKSLQESTTNAMRALMDLSNQNTTSAIQNGYTAFGQYQNSNSLDGLRIANVINGLKMDSVGAFIASNGGKSSPFMAPPSSFATDYARLDPSFLYQGQAAQVADQFEKASGMSRKDFLKAMASASESTISVNDPQLVDKVLNRFEGFLKEVPNADFRKKVQQEIDSVPSTVRTGVISKALQKAASMVASNATSDIAVQAKNDKTPPSDASAGASNVTAADAKPADAGDDRGLASITGVKPAIVGKAEYSGLDYEKFGNDAVGSTLQTAIDEQGGEDTIFKQISRKYRSLTGTLTQRPM